MGDPSANASAHAFEMSNKDEKKVSEETEELDNPKLNILTKEKTPKKPKSSPDRKHGVQRSSLAHNKKHWEVPSRPPTGKTPKP